MNSKEEISHDFCPNYVQEFCLRFRFRGDFHREQGIHFEGIRKRERKSGMIVLRVKWGGGGEATHGGAGMQVMQMPGSPRPSHAE